MEVEAFNLKLKNVLSKGQFTIPEYQREFEWEIEHIEELINDLENLETNHSHFIGHMVCEGKFNGNHFKVVDGQQRITTITIILSVIRDIFYEGDLNDLSAGIHNNYIFRKDVDNKEFVILENQMPYPILQAYIQNLPNKKNKSIRPLKTGEKKIKQAYDFLLKTLREKNTDQLKDLRDKILDLEVIFVSASEEVNAHSIFMTLNATGKDLTPVDLIKNQIFSCYPKQIHIDEPNDTWKRIMNNVDNKKVKFFNNFWASRYKKVADNRLFKEFMNDIIRNENNIEDFLKQLHEDSILFKMCVFPERGDWKVEEIQAYFSINAIIKVFNMEISNAILMSLIRAYKNRSISLRYLLKTLKEIERFHFIHNAICSKRSSGLDHFYAKTSKVLFTSSDRQTNHAYLDNMIIELKEKTPSFQTFNSNFDSKMYFSSKRDKQKKLIQYALKKLELKYQNENVELHNLSLEHICPENPTEERWQDIPKDLIINIGNLVLLDAKLNSSIGNKTFEVKKNRIMEKSTLLSTKEVFEKHNDWTSEDIKARRDELAHMLYEKIWL